MIQAGIPAFLHIKTGGIMTNKPSPKNDGHRQRLRNRFLKSGFSGFQDYEAIELLLSLTTPRKNCKIPARNALTQFGSFSAVLSADPERLELINGIGPTNVLGIKIVRAAAERYLEDKIENLIFAHSSQEVLDYLTLRFKNKDREAFSVLFLNGRNQIVGHEVLFEGTLTSSVVYPREFVKRMLFHRAAAAVLVHNHPSGNPTPSREDEELTQRLKIAAETVDMRVFDHIIIAGSQHYSFADHGKI